MLSSTAQEGTKKEANQPPKRTSCSCLNAAKMLLAALPSIVFGAFTVIFTLQQNLTARENRKQDQAQATEQNIRSTFENYVHDISALLLDRKFNKSDPEHLLYIRIKTMAVLRHVDPYRRHDIIWFLYESRLLRGDRPAYERLNLHGCDLSGIQFIGRPGAILQMPYLYLPGVYAPDIVFKWCNITSAVFDGSYLKNAKIFNSFIVRASFSQVYASGFSIGDLILHENSFQSAILRGMEFASGVDIFGWVDLTNADLLDSFRSSAADLNTSSFEHPLVSFRNARFFDGSFGPIDQSNKILNGDAEEMCKSNPNETIWHSIPPYNRTEIADIHNDSKISNPSNIGKCSFVGRSVGETAIGQYVILDLFSVLVDSGQALYNISTYAGCYGQGSSQVTVNIVCYKESALPACRRKIMSTNSPPQQWNSIIGSIPVNTRVLEIELYSSVVNSSELCLLDNIMLTIYNNKTK